MKSTPHTAHKQAHASVYLFVCISKVKSLSRVQLFATLWAVAYQPPPSMGFSRQEYWSGLPFPSPVDLPDPGIEPRSPALQADALFSEPPGKPLLVTASSKNNVIRTVLQDSTCNTGRVYRKSPMEM